MWFRWYIQEKVIAAFFSLTFGHTHVTFTSGEPTRRDIAGDYQGKVVSAGSSFCSSLQVPMSSGSPRMFPLLPALLVIWFLLSFPSTPSSFSLIHPHRTFLIVFSAPFGDPDVMSGQSLDPQSEVHKAAVSLSND